MNFDLTTSLIVLGLSVFGALIFGYRGAVPPSLKGGPRLVPWRFFMLLAATLAIMMLVHILTLLGLKSDPPTRY